MTKKCTCKNGETDPKCPACSKGKINLDSFHKLNPEAKPRKDHGPMSKEKTAKVEQFKIANPYGPDPYYGQYGHDHRDEPSSGLNTALMLGAGTLGAAGLHSSLMNARGKIRGGGLINAYQKGIGGGIRRSANTLRGHLDMAPVAQPPHPILGHAMDAVEAAKARAGEFATDAAKYTTPVMAAGGTAMTAKALHDKWMAAPGKGGDMYRRFVGNPVAAAGGRVADSAGRAADWAARKMAPKPKAATPEAETYVNVKKQPKPPDETKVGSMIYQAGSEAALAAYAL